MLDTIYDKLRSALQEKKHLISDSVIISLLDKKSNKRSEYLKNVSFTKDSLTFDEYEEAKDNDFIRELGEGTGVYTLTLKALWDIECLTLSISEEKMLEYLDKKHFVFDEFNQPLTEKEKVIILAMIGARSFSKESAIDLHKSDSIIQAWRLIFEQTHRMLYNLKIIRKLNIEDLFGKEGNEEPVSNLIRHTDALQKKTSHIFKVKVPQKYFLNLDLDDGESSKNSLKLLYKKILESELSLEVIDLLKDFCDKIAHENSLFIFEMEKHKFNDLYWDDLIVSSLNDLIYS